MGKLEILKIVDKETLGRSRVCTKFQNRSIIVCILILCFIFFLISKELNFLLEVGPKVYRMDIFDFEYDVSCSIMHG